MEPFPVQYLDVTNDVLMQLNGILNPDLFSFDGRPSPGKLQNRVETFDDGGHLTQIAYIVSPDNVVHISLTYMQILWMLDYAIFTTYDSLATKQEFEAMSPNDRRIFLEEVRLNPELADKRYIFEIADFEQTTKRAAIILKSAIDLYNRKFTDDEIKNLAVLCPTHSEYGKKMNSVYEEGIAFTMLHEYAHFALKHRTPSLDNEIAADEHAMRILYERSSPEKQMTVGTGIISVFASFILLSGSVFSDPVHPDRDDRMFALLDVVSSEHKEKLFPLVRYYLHQWAFLKGFDDFPASASINELKGYMRNYKSTTRVS